VRPIEFFEKHPVFTLDEFKRYAISQHSLNENTQKEILAYHLRKKNITRIRRGLFASIPLSFRDTAESYVIDPYLIAGRINDDAVLAYHSALDFHGVSYTLSQQMIFLSQQKIQPFVYQQTEFTRLPLSNTLVEKKKTNTEVMSVDRQGLNIKVTSLERTIVDALDRPEYAGGFEEIWRSAAHIPILNFDKMIEYAILLDNATTIAKLGFFLEQYQKQFNVDEKALIKLQAKKPAGVHYLERSKRETGKFMSRWNLMVPRRIIEQEWEEPDNDSI